MFLLECEKNVFIDFPCIVFVPNGVIEVNFKQYHSRLGNTLVNYLHTYSCAVGKLKNFIIVKFNQLLLDCAIL